MPKKRKSSATNKPGPHDECQTPGYGVAPIHSAIPLSWVVWEPAAGEGLMVEALEDLGHTVISSTIESGGDFFNFQPNTPWDCIVTNPPYSLKYDWIERCYALGKPWALLLPVETLGAGRAQRLFDENRPEHLALTFMSHRIDFKMPYAGWGGKGAHFPVVWVSWAMDTVRPVNFYDMAYQKKVWKEENAEMIAVDKQIAIAAAEAKSTRIAAVEEAQREWTKGTSEGG